MSRLTPRSESLFLSFRLLTAQLEPDIYVQWNTFVTCVQLQHCFWVTTSATRTKLSRSAGTGRRCRLTCRHGLYGLFCPLAEVCWYWYLILRQASSQTINTVGDTAAIASVYTYIRLCTCGPSSSVGIATDYGLDGPGSNPGGDEIFIPSRPALGLTQPPIKWVSGLSRG